jgi:hypothetical protein
MSLTIKTDSHIVSMTTPASPSVNRDSSVTYAGMKDKQDSNKLTRKESSENRAIYKNVCHIKSPSLEVKVETNLGDWCSTWLITASVGRWPLLIVDESMENKDIN